MIKFSIIIPVYNVEKYLDKCFNSVINQAFNNYEVIIICDKCTDNSEKIVDKYIKKYTNFKKIYKENTGLSVARNIGVESSNGEYILFLDSDDYLEKDLLQKLDNELKNPIDIIRFQAQNIIDDKLIKYNEKVFEITNGIEAFNFIINYHYIENAWLYCYNSKFYKNNNFHFKENVIAEDFGLIPLIIAKAKSVKSLSYIGYNYVMRNNSLMNNNNYQQKIKKMNDMFEQANELKKELLKIKNSEKFLLFINNSLIYYSTTLKYKDYKNYNKLLKQQNAFNYYPSNTYKQKIKKFLIKNSSYLYYNYIVRFYG